MAKQVFIGAGLAAVSLPVAFTAGSMARSEAPRADSILYAGMAVGMIGSLVFGNAMTAVRPDAVAAIGLGLGLGVPSMFLAMSGLGYHHAQS